MFRKEFNNRVINLSNEKLGKYKNFRYRTSFLFNCFLKFIYIDILQKLAGEWWLLGETDKYIGTHGSLFSDTAFTRRDLHIYPNDHFQPIYKPTFWWNKQCI